MNMTEDKMSLSTAPKSRVEDFPKDTGAIRRASMDLTRALANLRK
jgi:hypothetical protein